MSDFFYRCTYLPLPLINECLSVPLGLLRKGNRIPRRQHRDRRRRRGGHRFFPSNRRRAVVLPGQRNK